MKKFYLLFIAMMVSLAASATDYYLVGGFNGWTLKDSKAKFTDNGDGTFKCEYKGEFTGEFKINDGTWNNNDANFGGGKNLEPNKEHKLTKNGDNMSLSAAVKDPVFVLNPTALTLSYTTGGVAEVSYVYVLCGQFEGSGWNDVTLTEGANGIWSVSEAEIKGDGTSGKFQVRKNVQDKNTTVQYIKTDSDGKVTFGADNKYEATCKVGGQHDFTIAVGKYSFAFNPADMKLTIVNINPATPDPDPTPEPDPVPDPTTPTCTYNIHGTILGSQQWTSYPMTLKDGVWRICGNLTSGSFGIREMENGDQKQWYSSAGDGNINAEGEYACMVQGKNFNNTLTGLHVISFDPATPMLTVKAANQFRYKLWGQFAGKTWSRVDMNLDWDKYEKGQEYWYAEGVNVVGENGNAAFGIQKAEWETGTQVQWISHNGSGTVAVGNNYDCKPQGTDFKIPAGQYTFVYDPNENKLYVNAYDNTVTSITDILGSDAPAEYYNLQGVRVDQPESGVYIMRKGNKTFKVIK